MPAQSQAITFEVSYPDDRQYQEVVEQLQRLCCTVDTSRGFHITLPPRSFQSLYRRTATVESGPNCFDENCESETVRLEESHYVSYVNLAEVHKPIDQHTIHWTWQRKRLFSFDVCFCDTSALSWRMLGGALEDSREEEGCTGEIEPQ